LPFDLFVCFPLDTFNAKFNFNKTKTRGMSNNRFQRLHFKIIAQLICVGCTEEMHCILLISGTHGIRL